MGVPDLHVRGEDRVGWRDDRAEEDRRAPGPAEPEDRHRGHQRDRDGHRDECEAEGGAKERIERTQAELQADREKGDDDGDLRGMVQPVRRPRGIDARYREPPRTDPRPDQQIEHGWCKGRALHPGVGEPHGEHEGAREHEPMIERHAGGTARVGLGAPGKTRRRARRGRRMPVTEAPASRRKRKNA